MKYNQKIMFISTRSQILVSTPELVQCSQYLHQFYYIDHRWFVRDANDLHITHEKIPKHTSEEIVFKFKPLDCQNQQVNFFTHRYTPADFNQDDILTTTKIKEMMSKTQTALCRIYDSFRTIKLAFTLISRCVVFGELLSNCAKLAQKFLNPATNPTSNIQLQTTPATN